MGQGEAVADTYRIAIVGSGPAGMSAAAHAAKLGIKHVLLEKTDHLSDTIYKYQKGKHVMATPPQLVLRSDVDFDAGKREDILGIWDQQTAAAGVNVRMKSEVKSITGTKGDFTLTLTDKTEIKAENVILAIGTQGNPNLLRCPGADQNHLQLQYQLDDPAEYIDEHITVIGAGDAGIENALGLAEDVVQGNIVSIVNRTADFSRAKKANVDLLVGASDDNRMNIITDATPNRIEAGYLVLDTRDGEARIRCDRIIARMGSAAPRKFVEECGIQFTSPDREAFPQLSSQFETTNPGIYVIGALAGYPLIKHCMNQGYDIVEFINGNLGSTSGSNSSVPTSRSLTTCRRFRCASSCSIRTSAFMARTKSSSRRARRGHRCSVSPRVRSTFRFRTAARPESSSLKALSLARWVLSRAATVVRPSGRSRTQSWSRFRVTPRSS
jgi:thioredoxin reductase